MFSWKSMFMKVKLHLLLFLFSIPFVGFSYVKSIELDYNQMEVYKGNEFSLNFTSHTNRDVLHESSNPKSKYRVENFIIQADISIKVIRSQLCCVEQATDLYYSARAGIITYILIP